VSVIEHVAADTAGVELHLVVWQQDLGCDTGRHERILLGEDLSW
jgi:hypothetical protein